MYDKNNDYKVLISQLKIFVLSVNEVPTGLSMLTKVSSYNLFLLTFD